jgi:putative membrane protein
MLRPRSLNPLLPAAWLGVLALAGCGPRDRSETTADATAARSDTVASADVRPDTAESSERLSDANIVALLDEANKADSSAGAVAVGKATNAEVKAFARLMMSEHHALRQQGKDLAARLKVTPEPPATDPLKPLAESEMTALKSTPKGARFDQVYIEQEVAAHKAVLDLVDDAHDQAQNEQLKALIEKAKPVIQKHLDQAEALQDKLGKPTT